MYFIAWYNANLAVGLSDNRACHGLFHGDTYFTKRLICAQFAHYHLFHSFFFETRLGIDEWHIYFTKYMTLARINYTNKWTPVAFTGQN
jgi:hypothetical protein